MDNTQPIIVKRVKKVAGGHHGGAWKIAFADFATAMMAFFLVMWLMSSATPEQKKLISGYFQDPIGFTESASPHVIDLGGTPTPSPDRTLNPELEPAQSEAQIDSDQVETFAEQLERERLELLLQELQNKVDENPELQKFKDQILFEITQDGLRIQIMDAENRPMFALGSAQLQPYFEDILLALVDTIAAVPNKISVSGHTDAKPFSGRSDFGNWELSAGRANAARRTLVIGGYPEDQIARVVGYASSALFDRKDPLNPVNRRIDILVLTKKAQRSIEDEQPAATDSTGAAEGEVTPSGGAAPAGEEPLQPEQLRERLNIFEDGVLQFSQPGEG
ncbi:flagellar motor protein MotB [Stutzerimonas stutzeri]|uniref:flagellar motor protein MotB n=1 Tax=Stutzerimonas stutzeri subgroup TaxID=578833 RepID=UPI000C6ED95F|nr:MULTISPECIES: flagellar motor protein MotB [Stutzerimonas stutzeri subgroup]MCQ2045594.1 flagellar motor protein MotB [Stutzerimonas kunmingensis]PKR27503.1 motility protein MotB [Stutzerimonas stutzeri]QQC11145.1 flagellar motor protein MotB [Stutzerimonas stutzeri]VEI30681.1 flagellar motor protein MotB [Stutzerimonas stutzeri]